MKTKTLVVGYLLTLALLVFAKRHPDTAAQPSGFKAVVDLTRSAASTSRTASINQYPALGYGRPSSTAAFTQTLATRIDAPASFAPGLWTVDQIPAERLIAPLVVIDVRLQSRENHDYLLSVVDIANWEDANGQIAPGSVVVARTGWDEAKGANLTDQGPASHFPGYSAEAAQFLVEGREVLGVGIDTPSVDPGSSKDFSVHKYTLAHSVYHLENITNLERTPANNAVIVVAPEKLQGATVTPVRVLALLR